VVPKLVRSTTAVFLLATSLLLGYGPEAAADTVANSSPPGGGDVASTHAQDSQPSSAAGSDQTGSASTSSHTDSASTSAGPTSTLGSGRQPGDPQVATHDDGHTPDPAVIAGTPSVDTTATHSSDAAGTQSANTAGTQSTDTTAASSTSTNAASSTSTNAASSTSTTAVSSTVTAGQPPAQTTVTQSTDDTQTPPALIAGTLLTGTGDMGASGAAGTDSSSTATDWGSTVIPPADDSVGPTHDTVAAPAAATAPVVSTTVDASPPATVETSMPTTKEASTVAVESDVDPPAAQASAVPALTDVAPTDVGVVPPLAAAVPPPAAVCITAGNCTTVLQAMLTSAANMAIAPLTTISCWFGAIWYQANPEAALRVPSQWTAAGAQTGSELASLVMPSGLPTALRYSTVHGGTSSVGETVLDQIDNLEQTTQASSSSPASSRVAITSSATAPRNFTGLVQHALDTIASSPSLIVLTVAALPGLGGFIIIIGAGMRIGYRQAKFGFAMRSSDLARYVRPGPLGVVRSGSLIALRPRTRSQQFVEKAA
jgi:hypothetical protein